MLDGYYVDGLLTFYGGHIHRAKNEISHLSYINEI